MNQASGVGSKLIQGRGGRGGGGAAGELARHTHTHTLAQDAQGVSFLPAVSRDALCLFPACVRSLEGGPKGGGIVFVYKEKLSLSDHRGAAREEKHTSIMVTRGGRGWGWSGRGAGKSIELVTDWRRARFFWLDLMSTQRRAVASLATCFTCAFRGCASVTLLHAERKHTHKLLPKARVCLRNKKRSSNLFCQNKSFETVVATTRNLQIFIAFRKFTVVTSWVASHSSSTQSVQTPVVRCFGLRIKSALVV